MEFKRWMRAPYVANGETKIRFDEPSSNTLSMVKLENPFIIPEIELAGSDARQYIKINEVKLSRESDPHKTVISYLCEKHPALDGQGQHKFFLSEAGWRELIDRAWWGAKTAAGNLYDKENARTATNSGHVLKQESSKTYRKQSKPSTRQVKQHKRGRPKK